MCCRLCSSCRCGLRRGGDVCEVRSGQGVTGGRGGEGLQVLQQALQHGLCVCERKRVSERFSDGEVGVCCGAQKTHQVDTHRNNSMHTQLTYTHTHSPVLSYNAQAQVARGQPWEQLKTHGSCAESNC